MGKLSALNLTPGYGGCLPTLFVGLSLQTRRSAGRSRTLNGVAMRGYAVPMKSESVVAGAVLVVVGLSSLDLHHEHMPHTDVGPPDWPERSARAEGAIYVSGSASVVLKMIPALPADHRPRGSEFGRFADGGYARGWGPLEKAPPPAAAPVRIGKSRRRYHVQVVTVENQVAITREVHSRAVSHAGEPLKLSPQG